MAITGRPSFSGLKDPELVRQFSIVWDAIISLSFEIEAVRTSVPSITELEAKVDNLDRRIKRMEASLL